VLQPGSYRGGESAIYLNLAPVAEDQDDLDRAYRLHAESLSLSRASGWRWITP
jgi:hypothetical protein